MTGAVGSWDDAPMGTDGLSSTVVDTGCVVAMDAEGTVNHSGGGADWAGPSAGDSCGVLTDTDPDVLAPESPDRDGSQPF